jgi:hypothetical protein
MRKTDLGFLNYAAIDENSRRPNPPSRRISVTWSGHSLRQRCSNMQAGNSQFNGSKRSQFSLQAAFSLFSGNIYPIDLTGNRGLIPSGSVTIMVGLHLRGVSWQLCVTRGAEQV